MTETLTNTSTTLEIVAGILTIFFYHSKRANSTSAAGFNLACFRFEIVSQVPVGLICWSFHIQRLLCAFRARGDVLYSMLYVLYN